MKKALIYDPYFDTIGGGERYALSVAVSLLESDYEVHLAWKEQQVVKEAEKRFGADYSKIVIDVDAYVQCRYKSPLMQRLAYTSKYDLIFWISDGSLPLLFSKNNLIHFQVPFTQIGGSSMVNSIKLKMVKHLVFNSEFTKNIIERNLPSDKGVVVYPPVDTASFTPGVKENIILGVGRFDSPSHPKRQDVLVAAFKKIFAKNKSFKLVLAGGLKGDQAVINTLKAQAKDLPIEFVINPDFPTLKALYAKAKIFWHGAGYEVDEEDHPEMVEHFGITTVEAMSAGCVPVVFAKGGQKEIIRMDTGFLSINYDVFCDFTLRLMAEAALLEEYSKKAIIRAQDFSEKRFNSEIKLLLK